MGTPQFRRGSIGQQAADTEAKTQTYVNPNPEGVGVRRNKYGGKCVNCGVFVPENAGMVDKRDGKWAVMHIETCPEHGTEEARIAEANTPEPTHQVNVVNGETLYDGKYTYETATSHRTFRLSTQGLDEEFMPGVQIVGHLTGPDNDSDYQSIGHIKGSRLYVWKKHQDRVTLVADLNAFFADPHGDHVAKSVACYRCGRTLTVPASVYNGLGPECAKKGGL